jgi:hypothetical protein
MDHLTDTFIDALRQLEEHDDVETIAGLFRTKQRFLIPHRNMTALLRSGQLTATRSTRCGQHLSVLQQATESLSLSGKAKERSKGYGVSDEGVSVIESVEGQITAFRAYFDPAKLSATLPVSTKDEPTDSDAVNAAREAAAERAGGGYD